MEKDAMMVLYDGETIGVGDYIEVKDTYIEQDTQENLKGHRACIIAFQPIEELILVEWDQETYQRIPESTRKWCEEYASDPTGRTYAFVFDDIQYFKKVRVQVEWTG